LFSSGTLAFSSATLQPPNRNVILKCIYDKSEVIAPLRDSQHLLFNSLGLLL